jgi:hypothetical protein
MYALNHIQIPMGGSQHAVVRSVENLICLLEFDFRLRKFSICAVVYAKARSLI